MVEIFNRVLKNIEPMIAKRLISFLLSVPVYGRNINDFYGYLWLRFLSGIFFRTFDYEREVLQVLC